MTGRDAIYPSCVVMPLLMVSLSPTIHPAILACFFSPPTPFNEDATTFTTSQAMLLLGCLLACLLPKNSSQPSYDEL